MRITDAKIGIAGDDNLITLTSGVATVDGKVSSTTLETTGAATLDSATVTNALSAGATTVSSLTTSGDLLMTEDAAVLTHSAGSGTSLAISSTNGYVSIAGGTGKYVDVESVRITDAKIGLSNDDNIITLSSDGTTGNVAVAGTLSTTGAATLDSATVTNALGAGATSVTTLSTSGAATLASATVTGSLTADNDVSLSKQAAAITHSHSSGTSLTISSTNGYVAVESTLFTGSLIGLAGNPDLITLSDSEVAVEGKVSSTTLETSGAATLNSLTVTNALGAGATTVTTLTTSGAATLDSATVTNALGAGATTVSSLTTSGELDLTADAAVLKHSGSVGGSLAISSTNGYVSIAGATGKYVDVESVRITNKFIGLSDDAEIIELSNNGVVSAVTIDGTLGAGATTVSSLTTSGDLLMTEDAAVLTHSAGSGTSLAISSTNGYVSIAGSYVDVESVRITDAKIGIAGDDNLITLTSGVATVDGKVSSTTLETTGAATLDSATVTNALGAGATTVSSLTTSGDLLMTEDAAVLTHSAGSGTSLAISSTNGYVSIAGSYVDVESVRFTGDAIGIDGDPDIITLTSGVATVAGKVHTTTLETTGAATLDSATVTNALGAGATTVSSLTTSGDLLMTEDAAVLTHSAGSGTSLAISSTNGYVSIAGSYVDVESVRITDAKIGIAGDDNLITLTSGVATVDGKVSSTTLETTGARRRWTRRR